MTTTKNLWTAILLWMALFSFTLSAQVTTIDLSNSANLTNGSYIISSAGTYCFTGTYPTAPIEQSEGTAVISVEAEGDVTIILDGVDITLSEGDKCPLSARNANGTVTVQLKGENKLTSSGQCPALWAPETTTGKLIIEKSSETGSEVGSLTATASSRAPGIGSISEQGSYIEIKSGKITAYGGDYAAGIGGGFYGSGGEITIEGGEVTATGGQYGAGIGGGFLGDGGTITISGETTNVTANGGDYAAGIGGGYGEKGAGGEITITGREVKATGGKEAAGIGYGKNYNGTDGTITITGGTVTVTNGSNVGTATDNDYDINGYTVVVGPDATVQKSIIDGTLDCNYVNGFVFKDKKADVKGDATLLADITIDNGEKLTF